MALSPETARRLTQANEAAPDHREIRIRFESRASLLDYQQWNIDEQSIVSFASLTFRGA